MRHLTEKQALRRFGAKRLLDAVAQDDSELKTAHYRAHADDVLEAVDEQLRPHGLEVVLHDTDDDGFRWHIEARKAKGSNNG